MNAYTQRFLTDAFVGAVEQTLNTLWHIAPNTMCECCGQTKRPLQDAVDAVADAHDYFRKHMAKAYAAGNTSVADAFQAFVQWWRYVPELDAFEGYSEEFAVAYAYLQKLAEANGNAMDE